MFTALKTNIDFNTAVSKESVVGKSYIQVTDPNGEDSVLLSLDGLSYDASTKTFIQKEAGGWYAAACSSVSGRASSGPWEARPGRRCRSSWSAKASSRRTVSARPGSRSLSIRTHR